MLSCYRYIELNPVRAGMVRHPRDYRWSSFHANGDGRRDALITPDEQYLRLARNEDARRAAYRALFKAHMDLELIDSIRGATNSNTVLGGERFARQIATMLKRRVTRGRPGRPCRSDQTGGS